MTRGRRRRETPATFRADAERVPGDPPGTLRFPADVLVRQGDRNDRPSPARPRAEPVRLRSAGRCRPAALAAGRRGGPARRRGVPARVRTPGRVPAVYSPPLGRRELYERSGHWAHFAEDM